MWILLSNIDLRCFVARQFLSQIYARLKMQMCECNFFLQILGMFTGVPWYFLAPPIHSPPCHPHSIKIHHRLSWIQICLLLIILPYFIPEVSPFYWVFIVYVQICSLSDPLDLTDKILFCIYKHHSQKFSIYYYSAIVNNNLRSCIYNTISIMEGYIIVRTAWLNALLILHLISLKVPPEPSHPLHCLLQSTIYTYFPFLENILEEIC